MSSAPYSSWNYKQLKKIILKMFFLFLLEISTAKNINSTSIFNDLPQDLLNSPSPAYYRRITVTTNLCSYVTSLSF